MSLRFLNYGVLLLFVGLLATAACDRPAVSVTGPSGSGLSSLRSSFAAEPLTLRPEFLNSASCVTQPAFGARVSFMVRGGDEVILRELRFGFTDRLGRRALPDVIPIPTLSVPAVPAPTIPSASPVPLPGIAALPGVTQIPIPGSAPIQGLLIPAGTSRALPFFLNFGCVVAPDGTLLINVDAGDRTGRFETSELQVRVGS